MICSIEDCKRGVLARGWCGAHYQRWYNHGDSTVVKIRVGGYCVIEKCKNEVYGRGWCRKHWKRWYRYGDPLFSKLRERRPRGLSLSDTVMFELDRAIVKENGCVEHSCLSAEFGYGRIHFEGKVQLLHRLVLSDEVGRLLESKEFALHYVTS